MMPILVKGDDVESGAKVTTGRSQLVTSTVQVALHVYLTVPCAHL